MKYLYKVFLWGNGKKTKDFSQYLTYPIFYEDRLNEELDTGEFVLDDVPIDMKDPFPPKTKFRLERYSNDKQELLKQWDVVVEHDDVELYEGMQDKCCHRVNFIEPSVIAQGMHVDNIAMTYELQDVTLNYKTYKEDSTLLNDLVNVVNIGHLSPRKEPANPNSAFEYESTGFPGPGGGGYA